MKQNLNSHWDYPPYPFLEQVVNHCPKAASTYMWLWKNQDDNNVLRLDSTKIPDLTMTSKATFNHHLRDLCKEGLLSYVKDEDELEVELVNWEDLDE